MAPQGRPGYGSTRSTSPHSIAVVASIGSAEKASAGGVETADATGQADGPAGTGDEAQPDLGQRERCVLRTDDGAGEGCELDARSHAGPVQIGDDRLVESGQRATDAALQPHQVRRGRVGPCAELVEIATGAERPPLTTPLDAVMPGSAAASASASTSSSRIWASSAFRRSGRVSVITRVLSTAFDPHAWPLVTIRSRRIGGTPGCELRARLQHRVGGRLGHQSVCDRTRRRGAQQERQGGRGNGLSGQVLLDPSEDRVVVGECDVAQLEPGRVDGSPGHAHDDERQADQAIDGLARRWVAPPAERDQHGGTALGRNIAAQLGQERIGAQVFENRETLPCRGWTTPG